MWCGDRLESRKGRGVFLWRLVIVGEGQRGEGGRGPLVLTGETETPKRRRSVKDIHPDMLHGRSPGPKRRVVSQRLQNGATCAQSEGEEKYRVIIR